MDVKRLAVVIPVYNEQACIEEVITTWGNFLMQYLKEDIFKIIVVNDGSKDKTGEILQNLEKRVNYLQVINQKNGGHGNATLNGYREAVKSCAEWIFQVDGDNQFIPEDFPKFWDQRTNSNFIIGYRKKRYDDMNRLIITRILKSINLLFFGTYIVDSNIPYRLIKGAYMDKLLKVLPGEPFAPNIFLAVLAKKDGNDLMSIPVVHKERKTGQVSIIKLRLLKVCFRTTKELFGFSRQLKKRLTLLKESNV
jgi:dolichol-phosphate mannosyltransferase